MSMIANLIRVSKEDLESYLKDPSLFEARISQEENEPRENPALIDIDKAWDGILYLLTGQNFENSSHPLKKLLFSGQFINESQDLGYGPANYLRPEQVKELNAQIVDISTTELAKKYDPDKMRAADVYPNAWEPGEMCDYLIEYFESVQEVFAAAAKNDEAVITFLS